MTRTLFYTQIKTNDFNDLKTFCVPFTKDIFGANHEHIVAFSQPQQACTAALQFLNLISNRDPTHNYKIVLIDGELVQDRPQDQTVRIARSIHQQARSKNLYVTDEVLAQIKTNDIVFEKKDEVMVKDLQKHIPTYVLNRFENIELIVDPMDLFDFSQVDSYSSMDKVKPTNVPVKDPFESSNTTIELDAPKKLESDTKSNTPPPSIVMKPVAPRPSSSPKAAEISTESQMKSLVIIIVLLVLTAGAGLYLARNKSVEKNVFTHSTKPLPTTETAATTGTTEISAASTDSFVNIHSTPTGAEVWMNGEKMKKHTPLDNVKVDSEKSVTIEVQKSGYDKVTKKVDLEPSETLTVVFELEADKTTAPAPTKPETKAKPVSTKKKK